MLNDKIAQFRVKFIESGKKSFVFTLLHKLFIYPNRICNLLSLNAICLHGKNM
jgi:hypothetical protein